MLEQILSKLGYSLIYRTQYINCYTDQQQQCGDLINAPLLQKPPIGHYFVVMRIIQKASCDTICICTKAIEIDGIKNVANKKIKKVLFTKTDDSCDQYDNICYKGNMTMYGVGDEAYVVTQDNINFLIFENFDEIDILLSVSAYSDSPLTKTTCVNGFYDFQIFYKDITQIFNQIALILSLLQILLALYNI